MPVYYELLLDEPLDARCRRGTPSGRWRGRSRRATTGRRRPRRAAGALRRRCTCAHELPDQIEDFAFSANGGRCTCRRCWRRPSACRARRRAGCWGSPACKLDGEALDDAALDLPAERARRRRDPAGQAAPQAAAPLAEASGRSRCYTPPSRLRRSGVPTPEGARSLKTQQCTRPESGRSRFDPVRAFGCGEGPEQTRQVTAPQVCAGGVTRLDNSP